MFTNLKQKRMELGLTQQQAADFVGINKGSYTNYEYKNMGSSNPNGKKIIASGILGVTEEEKIRERNKHRIPNIPNFYERLRKIERGKISRSDPDLIKLQIDLGVVSAQQLAPKPKGTALSERENFANLLKGYRGNITKVEFSRRLGVRMNTYNTIETELRSSDSKAMQGLLTNDYFTKRQQQELTQVYDRMRAREWEEEMGK